MSTLPSTNMTTMTVVSMMVYSDDCVYCDLILNTAILPLRRRVRIIVGTRATRPLYWASI